MDLVKTRIIGVMSGTSLDGIDIAEVLFWKEKDKLKFSIGQACTIAYDPNWVKRLKGAIWLSDEELERLNQDYTRLLGDCIYRFILDNKLINIEAVSSHGHTVRHQPDRGLTLQIGNLPSLTSYVQQKIVCDFRVQDVKLGGQGAPLVPIGDRLLFSEYDYCLNLGGFSNISFEERNIRRAYDISPVNTVLNHYASLLGYTYDKGGMLAREGLFDRQLFERLNALPYYKQPYPKSLGVEFLQKELFLITEGYPFQVILRTFVEHVAHQISLNLPKSNSSVLVTGGGAYNEFLIERLRERLPRHKIILPDNNIIDYKEALIFALLGYLKLQNKVNVLSSVTGAQTDHSSGVIYDFKQKNMI